MIRSLLDPAFLCFALPLAAAEWHAKADLIAGFLGGLV